MEMKFSSEMEYLVLENLNLVNYMVLRLGVTPNTERHEELKAIGNLGLIKAAITYDASKGNAFVTYACRCIQNEIFMQYRKESKYEYTVSLDTPIVIDKNGNEITLAEKIADSQCDFVEEIANKDWVIQLINIILNNLKSRERLLMLYRIGEAGQKEIAEKLNISQSYVSRLQKIVVSKIKKACQMQSSYEQGYSLEITNSELILEIRKDIDWDKILMKISKTLSWCKVNRYHDKVVISIPAKQKAFILIAEIIEQIENYLK